MDDLLVLILTVAIGAIGALSQKKRKKASPNSAPQSKPETTSFWDMIMDETNRVVPEPEPAIEVMPEVEPEPKVVEKVEQKPERKYQFKAENEGQSGINDKIKTTVQRRPKKVFGDEGFSLKKAVIYNEILNRKYT